MGFDKIFNLTAGVYFYFYNKPIDRTIGVYRQDQKQFDQTVSIGISKHEPIVRTNSIWLSSGRYAEKAAHSTVGKFPILLKKQNGIGVSFTYKLQGKFPPIWQPPS